MKCYSVLMSVYHKDNPEYLRQSIESIMKQTIKPEQFVIVEDGPLTKALTDVIGSYVKSNSNLFSIVKLQRNYGLGVALDKGLIVCRNELVARMDSDDISLESRCEKQLKKFEENEALVLLGANIDEFYDDPKKIRTSRIVPSSYEDICKYIRRRDPFNHPTVMFKKSAVIRCGGYGSLRRRQDFDLFSRMINMGCYAENLNESLVLFRSNIDNYKRRKSKESCKSYINVVKNNYKRGYCSLFDLLYVIFAQEAIRLMPLGMMKIISDNLLRSKNCDGNKRKK